MRKSQRSANRIIREDEPQRPSTRVNTLGEKEQTTLAKHRKCDLDRLRSELSGDLDWVVMRPEL